MHLKKILHITFLQVHSVYSTSGKVVFIGIDEDILALLVELDKALHLVLSFGDLLY